MPEKQLAALMENFLHKALKVADLFILLDLYSFSLQNSIDSIFSLLVLPAMTP